MLKLEALLVRSGVAASPEQIGAVLQRARETGRHEVISLIEEGVVVEDVLADLLARGCGTVVVDLDAVPVESFAVGLIHRRVAEEHLMLPVAAPSRGKVRVAFANPLDQGAREAIESVSGMTVQPIVATVTGLRRGIERAYAVRPSTSPANEIPHEITKKVRSGDLRSTDTSPLLRIEEEGTLEQRHEALLLALVERGLLSRADYLEALRRILDGR